MGQYFTLFGAVRLSPTAYERAREVRLDDGRPASALMDGFGPCRYDAARQRLEVRLHTKRGHLFEGLVRVLAHVKDIDDVDELAHDSEYTPEHTRLYQLRPRAYREVDRSDRRVVYDLSCDDGWHPVPVLVMALRMSAEDLEMEVAGWFGVRRTIPLWEAGMPGELLGATQEQLDRFEPSSAGTEIEWPGLEASQGGTVRVDLGHVDGWNEEDVNREEDRG